MSTIYQVRMSLPEVDRDDVCASVLSPSTLYSTLEAAKASVEAEYEAERQDLEDGMSDEEKAEFPRIPLAWTQESDTRWVAEVEGGGDDCDPIFVIEATEVSG